MSVRTGAKRLRPEVPTDRFHWQRRSNPVPAEPTTVRSVFPLAADTERPEIASVLKQLPSPAADKLAAAEQAGFEKGYEAGHRDGYAAMADRTEDSFARLAAAVEEIRSLRAGVLHRAEREAVRLGIAIAEHVLHRTVATDPAELIALARHAIDRLDGTMATIHLHPKDYSAVAAAVTPSLSSGVELTADASLPPGGCLVKSSFGVVDLAIEAQVREVARALLVDEEEEDAAYGVHRDR